MYLLINHIDFIQYHLNFLFIQENYSLNFLKKKKKFFSKIKNIIKLK